MNQFILSRHSDIYGSREYIVYIDDIPTFKQIYIDFKIKMKDEKNKFVSTLGDLGVDFDKLPTKHEKNINVMPSR